MKWASAISIEADLDAAFVQLKRDLQERLDGAAPDLMFAFISPGYDDRYGDIPRLVRDHFRPGNFLGCTAMGVLAAGLEFEHHVSGQGAVALAAASLPDVDAISFHLRPEDIPDADAPPDRWVETLQVPPDRPAQFVLLSDPYFDPHPLLMGLDFAYANSIKVGGVASLQGDNALFLNRQVHDSGLVGIALQGDVIMDPIVAQGCRPVGQPLTVTRCEQNVLGELDERPALEVLAELYHSLSPDDQELATRALHLGIASTEIRTEHRQGDFLIRNLVHIDNKNGLIAVAARLRQGQTVQFHLRDAGTAVEDLQLMLAQYEAQQLPTQPQGGLLFTCNGHGQLFFNKPNHDSQLFEVAMGEVPLTGFFCGGEIGPVGADTHLHAYTSSFAVFRPRD